jgi:predicted DNA-binding transcriptional regulator YafY
MAVTKNPLIRYKILDKCFRNPGKRYFINDLVEVCSNALAEIDPDSGGISLRTIREDIAFMKRKEGWEIELGDFKEGSKMYYRYTDTSFSINNMPLNDLEIGQLQSAVNILTQFKGMPQFEWMHELVPKLKQGIEAEENIGTIIEFDSNQYLKGIEHLGALHSAIFYKKVLCISYQPFENETPSDIIIHPYYLKQYNNRWFLFGYNPENEKYDWNLALDRIVTISEIKGKYQKNTKIDWVEYFEDIIGVTKTAEASVENITLQFFEKTGKYIESKPLHGSQKAKWIDENTLEVKLQLIINYEFERLILSYADSVKVVKPKKLSDAIKNRLENAVFLYDSK